MPRSQQDVALDDAFAQMSDSDRDYVFAVAKSHGWEPGSSPPHYVWWDCIAKMEEAKEDKTSE